MATYENCGLDKLASEGKMLFGAKHCLLKEHKLHTTARINPLVYTKILISDIHPQSFQGWETIRLGKNICK